MSVRTLYCSVACLGLILLTGCLTPMSSEEIATLSVCPEGAKLDKVRSNLLEAGFLIKDQGKSDLSTDFHDEAMFSDGKSAKRITVLADDKGVLRFKVWEKRIFFESAGRIGLGSSFMTSSHTTIGSGLSIGIGPQCEHSFEQERTYYQQYRNQYELEQQMICKGSK